VARIILDETHVILDVTHVNVSNVSHVSLSHTALIYACFNSASPHSCSKGEGEGIRLLEVYADSCVSLNAWTLPLSCPAPAHVTFGLLVTGLDPSSSVVSEPYPPPPGVKSWNISCQVEIHAIVNSVLNGVWLHYQS